MAAKKNAMMTNRATNKNRITASEAKKKNLKGLMVTQFLFVKKYDLIRKTNKNEFYFK